MTKVQNSKRYDLEERTLKFAKEVIAFWTSLIREATELMKIFGSIIEKTK